MDRLTHERCNGIKTGYWSAAKKEELIQRLAAYENTGLEPKQIETMMAPCITVSLPAEEARAFAGSIRPTPDAGRIVPGSGFDFEQSWISVEDRLPEYYVPVIVCRKNGKVEQGSKNVGDWWNVYGTRTKNVTHWMPMPEPPEENHG